MAIDDFADLDAWNAGSSNVDALQEYLDAPIVKSCSDPIQYWTSQADGGNAALARMALDFLLAPGMSKPYLSFLPCHGLTSFYTSNICGHRAWLLPWRTDRFEVPACAFA